MNMNLQHTEKNVLYFSDLSLNVVQTDLELFLQDYKDSIIVINLDQKAQPNDFQKFLRAKVIFKDAESANRVRIEQNLKKIKGHSVRIMWDERDSSIRYNTKSNLFIKGIPESTTPREVYEFFMKFGDISSLKIPEDESGSHHGYGYITYYTPQDAENVIVECQKQEAFGVKLEVTHFQRKNERNYGTISTEAKTIYIKNFPDNYTEEKLKNLISQHGQVEKVTLIQGFGDSKYATALFVNEEQAKAALESLHDLEVEDKKLFVQPMQNKYERRQFMQNKIRESNIKLNEQYHLCNLHIRNIPFAATEDDLSKAFSKFGTIKSLKIEKFILDTQENNQRKEILTSKGFGYVCYENQESASKAKEGMNGKYLEGFEGWNRPILVEYFMPKQQRMAYKNHMIASTNLSNMQYPYYPAMSPFMIPRPGMMRANIPGGFVPRPGPGLRDFPQQGPRYPPRQPRPHQQQHRGNQMQQQKSKPSLIDEEELARLPTEDAKREYLGEIIYRAIEASAIAKRNNMNSDVISKITGMIIGIANIDEVIQTVRNENTLNNRIVEGLELLRNAGQADE